jgi:hypothetical protein
MMMEPFDAYRYYMAIKLHFESDTYDATRYNYKTSAKQQSFWKRKDKFHFAKLSKKFNETPELINYYVAQFSSEKKWIGDMMADDEVWTSWQRRNQSLMYTFEQDIYKIVDKVDHFDDLFKPTLSPYPNVVYYYMQDEICIETVVILDKLTGFMKKLCVTDTIVWPEVSKKIRKYSPFVRFDENKAKEIVLKVFTS